MRCRKELINVVVYDHMESRGLVAVRLDRLTLVLHMLAVDHPIDVPGVHRSDWAVVQL